MTDCSRSVKLTSYSDALRALAGCCLPGPADAADTDGAPGAVPLQPAIALSASPPFNSAAMDGFAVRAEDTLGATPAVPVDLPIAGEIVAGAMRKNVVIAKGNAIRVATGALTPPPLNSVIALEQANVIGGSGDEVLRVRKPLEKGRNLRTKGEEFKAGETFDFKGERLTAGHIALLTAAGVRELLVRKPPPLGLLTTGDEVRPPGAPLAPGEIVNVNSSWLAAWCAERRIPVALARHVRDDPGELAREFRNVQETGARILISSGSASAGRHDVLREALQELGARIIFHGVAMRPGKPALFALLEDGTPFFGLPGNPLATAAGMRFLVWPGIRAIMGMDAEKPQRRRLADPCDLREGYTHFLLARQAREAGMVKLVHPQRPGQASALAAADCWLRLEGGHTLAGALVDRYSL